MGMGMGVRDGDLARRGSDETESLHGRVIDNMEPLWWRVGEETISVSTSRDGRTDREKRALH